MFTKRFLAGYLVCAGMLVATGCTKNSDDDEFIEPPVSNELNGTLDTDMRLTADKTWILKGYVYVPDGKTLTIEPGTVIKSDVTQKGALCIERGGKIMAEGTADKPIVFTSGKEPGSREPGDWGGVVILGKAPTNRTTTAVIEGGLDRVYGGSDAADNSGVLKYVRIEYAGVAAFPNSEINGLTLAGVGSGTTIEHIQVSYGNDDAYEFFGGTVNAKYLIAFGTADDDFDFDYGYTGKIQFGIALRNPAFVDNGDAGNGIEADNDGSGTNAEPFTRPTLSNFTFIGPNNAPGTLENHNFGNRWRRAVRFGLHNSVMLGWQKAGFSMESDATVEAYKDGHSQFRNNIVHSNNASAIFKSSSAVMDAAAIEAKALTEGNVKALSTDNILANPFSLTAPDFKPVAGGPAASGTDFSSLDNYFTPTGFRGAIGDNNWLAGWTRFFETGQ